MPRCPKCKTWYMTRRGWNYCGTILVCQTCIPVRRFIEEDVPRRVEDEFPGLGIGPHASDVDIPSPPLESDLKFGGGDFGGAGASGSWDKPDESHVSEDVFSSESSDPPTDNGGSDDSDT